MNIQASQSTLFKMSTYERQAQIRITSGLLQRRLDQKRCLTSFYSEAEPAERPGASHLVFEVGKQVVLPFFCSDAAVSKQLYVRLHEAHEHL